MGRNVERGDSWTVEQDGAGIRLDKFLSAEARLGSRGRATEAIQRGKVFLNDREAAPEDAAVKLVAGDRVRVWVDRPGTSRSGFRPRKAGELEILYEDEWLLVVNKPAGLLVVPLPQRDGTPTVYDQVQHHLRPRGKRRPLIVHRIDRDTSGLVVFAKDAGAQERLKEQFRRREPERVYQAIVYGHPSPASGTWCDRLLWDRKSLIQKQTHASDPRGKEAISEYRVVERFEEATLDRSAAGDGEAQPDSAPGAPARTHARRRAALHLRARTRSGPIDFPRQALHAWRLGFRHPDDGRELRFEAAAAGRHGGADPPAAALTEVHYHRQRCGRRRSIPFRTSLSPPPSPRSPSSFCSGRWSFAASRATSPAWLTIALTASHRGRRLRHAAASGAAGGDPGRAVRALPDRVDRPGRRRLVSDHGADRAVRRHQAVRSLH